MKLLHLINIVLAILYFAMWVWAKTDPCAAATVALLLFVATVVVMIAVEPPSLSKGIIVKILFGAALMKARSAAGKAREAQRGIRARPR